MLRSNILPRSLSDALVTTFTFIIIPVIYYFEMFVVLPSFYSQWGPTYWFHFLTGTFILINICANFVAVILHDTSIKGRLFSSTLRPDWRFCTVCESVAPPRSWHCNTCNVCILKRDHHCMFTSCCVGHSNQRYFLVFVFYMVVASLYASFYNCYFIKDHVSLNSWISIFKLVFPLATIFMDWSESQLYIFLSLIVGFGCVFTSTLLYLHVKFMLKGVVTHERNEKYGKYDRGKKANVVEVLGDRWHLVWVSPFLESKLPSNGVDWDGQESQKFK